VKLGAVRAEPRKRAPDAARSVLPYDEMRTARSGVRPHYAALAKRIATLSADELSERQKTLERFFLLQGITFTVYGAESSTERIIPTDLLPRIFLSKDSATTEKGLIQRLKALNMFLADIYSAQQILMDGVVPRELVLTAPSYRREMQNLFVPNGAYANVCGSDLIRQPDGAFAVLEDNLRVPSGVSYVLENRLILTRVFPQLFASNRTLPVDHYTTKLLQNLRALSPRPQSIVVLLTPGVYNSAYFEHAFLAQQMGIDLVQGADLFVGGDDVVYMKTTRGPQRVDVIYRRIDDDFLDPDVFRPESALGVRGLMRAYAAGNVALANAVGTGVADDKVVYKYVPEIIKYYLDQEAILPNVPTYCAWEDTEREYLLANLDKLVVKSANESGGYGMLIGPQASRAERADFAERIKAAPRNYLAQPVVDLSTAPCFVAGEGIVPRRVDLRPYILTGPDGVTIIPGGLTRVALKEGSYVVNSSQGGGSKDTWVLAPVRRQTQSQSQSQSSGAGGTQTQSQSQSQGEDDMADAITAGRTQSQTHSGMKS